MKTLGKFKINPEKVISNDELVNLRGGYDPGTCAAICIMPDGGHICDVSRADAEQYSIDCNNIGGEGHWCCDSCGSASWYFVCLD